MVLQITFKLARSSYIEVKGLFRVLPVRDAIFGRFWYCRLLKKIPGEEYGKIFPDR